MRSILVSVLAGLQLLPLALAGGTLQLDLKRDASIAPALQRRQAIGINTFQADLVESPTLAKYFVNVSIGTPPQPLLLQLDTGSSDVWAIASNAAVHPPAGTWPSGTPGGTFDSNKSSTFNDTLPGDFGEIFADDSYTLGDYFQDTFSIGGVSVEMFQMGIAINTTENTGILGVGFVASEDNGQGTPYPNLVDTLVSQTIISTQAYSVWLDDVDAGKGQILFGGIDTGKFTGTLANIAMYPSAASGNIDAMTVAFTSLSITTSSGTTALTASEFPATAAVLDTGTATTVLPDDLAQKLFDISGATYNAGFDAAVLPCAARYVQGYLSFGFAGPDGPVIKVPISEMIFPAIINGTTVSATVLFPKAAADDLLCLLNVTPLSVLSPGIPLLMGDSVLRSAYVVFDLANERIGLAQTNFNSTQSNVVPFESLSAAIPSATTVSETSLTYSVTGTAVAHVTLSPFSQITTDFFSGSAGLAFSSVLAAVGSSTATTTGIQSTGTITPASPAATTKSAASSSRPFTQNLYIPFVLSAFLLYPLLF